MKNSNQTEIEIIINRIGNSLVKCGLQCNGITNNPREGIIPRGLFYEKRKADRPKIIVVGMNPGKCKKGEIKKYLEKDFSYSAVKNYIINNYEKIQYLKKAKTILNMIGFEGDIIWTNLVKCECSGENGKLPVQTLRTCIDKFLIKEINNFPKETAVVALGNLAFQFCALRFPDKFVVGLIHPASRGYHQFKNKLISNLDYYLNELKDNEDSNGKYKAIKLS